MTKTKQAFEKQEDFVRWNEEMSRKYDPEAYHLRSNFLIRWIERKRVQAVLDFIAATDADSVLEIGCGAGVVLSQFEAKRLIGVDLSGFMLQKARRRLADKDGLVLQANAEHLPFANGRFRKLVCTEVIEHVLEPETLVQEMARLAQDDATLVITIPNEKIIDMVKGWINKLRLGRWLLKGANNDQDDLAAYDSPENDNEWHLHYFDLELLEQVSGDYLSIMAVKAIPFSILPLRYVVSFRPKK